MTEQVSQSNVRTLEQNRAKAAWDNVQAVKNSQTAGDYKSLVKGAPAYIISNGLLQTLAFYKSKKKDHHTALVDHLTVWVCSQYAKDKTDLTELLRERDSYFLRLATQESLAYLQWLRRFADAEITKKSTTEEK